MDVLILIYWLLISSHIHKDHVVSSYDILFHLDWVRAKRVRVEGKFNVSLINTAIHDGHSASFLLFPRHDVGFQSLCLNTSKLSSSCLAYHEDCNSNNAIEVEEEEDDADFMLIVEIVDCLCFKFQVWYVTHLLFLPLCNRTA